MNIPTEDKKWRTEYKPSSLPDKGFLSSQLLLIIRLWTEPREDETVSQYNMEVYRSTLVWGEGERGREWEKEKLSCHDRCAVSRK